MLKNLEGERERERFLICVSGLKVEYKLPNNPSSKRTYRVNDIAESPARLRYV